MQKIPVHVGWDEKFVSREYWESDWEKFRFSAAAAAIHFLTSLPPSQRQQLRNLVVHEDHPSVAYPERQAQGLIPFCQENPALRIERRVALWRNLFLYSIEDGWFPTERRRVFASGRAWLEVPRIPNTVVGWMVEASLEIIPDTISLFLDGGPVPDYTADVFDDLVQRKLAWIPALDRVCPPEVASSQGKTDKIGSGVYLTDNFPRLMQALCDKNPSGLVRCNFDSGRRWEDSRIQEIVTRSLDYELGLASWSHAEGKTRRQRIRDTPPPLPSAERESGRSGAGVRILPASSRFRHLRISNAGPRGVRDRL